VRADSGGHGEIRRTLPVPDVTAGPLRDAGKLAEDIDQVIVDAEVAVEILKQGNLLADSAAYTMLRKVNQQVKARSQFDASLKDRFQAVVTYFASSPKNDTPPENSTK
jgi:argonaute-like protein implicated in RNA metabolism and viral defense